jgi:hypothetical protein
MIPSIGPAERGYLREFYEYVQAHLSQNTGLPGFSMIPDLAKDDVPKDELDRLVRAALVDGDWRPILEQCASQGKRFAVEGVPLAAWYGWTREFRAEILRTLAVTPVDDRRLLWRILEGLTLYQSFVVEAIAEGYLRTRE